MTINEIVKHVLYSERKKKILLSFSYYPVFGYFIGLQELFLAILFDLFQKNRKS